MLTRRGVLATLAGGAVAGTVAGCRSEQVAHRGLAVTRPLDPGSWASVKAQFALEPGVAHLAGFVFASHPATVREAIERHRRGLDADAPGYLAANEEALDTAVAGAAAAYLRTQPDQIAFTDSTTMGLGLLFAGLRLGPGDEVLTTEHDFYATHESLRLRQARDGTPVRRVRLYDAPETADADQIVQRLRAAVNPRTRVVALTWVHSSSGVKLPIPVIAGMLAEVGQGRDAPVLLAVDGVHGFGVEATTPDELGCDFFATGCHKWLFGPRGTGLLWGRATAWPQLTPVIPSFTAASIGAWQEGSLPHGPAGPAATPGGYHSFEHRWALAEAFALHQTIGMDRIAQRTRTLATALKDGLADLSGVTLRTPRSAELSAGIICCEVRGYRPREAVARLRAAGVSASVTPYATSYLRFGPSILTDESDVEVTIAAVRTLG
ncbi:MAG: aminotransferase class V-fold PLP-dependent enzyme [Micromonosporaceae bacterium]